MKTLLLMRHAKSSHDEPMLGNSEEAKDLAQEVFISVFESIKDLKEEIKFDAWLTQITLNHCRNRWKYLKRRQYFNSDSLDDAIETDGDMERALGDPSDNPNPLGKEDDSTMDPEGTSGTQRGSEGVACVERPPGIFL